MNKVQAVWTWLKGKKTYILSIALVLYAVSGLLVGRLSVKEVIDLLFGSGFMATLRAAIN